MSLDTKKSNRRDFIKAAAVTGVVAALAATLNPTLKALAATGQPTTCQGCTSWCASEVYVVDGRAVKVRGNANSKVNGSASCPKSHLALQQVYDPDRVKTPMKRTNPKKGRNEDPGFVPISWDEALNTVADKIMELRDNEETYKYMLLRGRYSYMRDIIYDRMTKIIGSPNNISHSSICAEAEKFGPYYTEGEWTYRQYDILNTRYILLWGADPISANRQVSYYLSAWGDAMDRAPVAVVDPRLSASAAKANEWLPIKPGEDGALACAIAHVILVEGLWYKDFVGDFTDGVNKFVAGQSVSEDDFEEIHTNGLVKWWNIELKDKTPEWAADKTGLPVEQIKRVAIGYGKAAPHAISWVGGGPVMQVRGAYASMACHALNGLVGAVDNHGGTLKANKEYTQSFPSPDDFIDDQAKHGKSDHSKIDHRGRKEFPALNAGKSGGGVVTNNAADGILNEDPNEIKVAISYMNNFAFSCPQSERWFRALAKIPFVVDITTNASEFTWFSDIILPSVHHMFEKWGYVKVHGNGYRHVTMNQPVIDTIWDVKQDETEIPWLIAEKLADRGFDNLLRHYKEYKDPETGSEPTNGQEFALYALKHATHKLWDPEEYQAGDQFNGWEDFRSAGVWNSAPYPFKKRWGAMKTVTEKFEFYSETLKEALGKHAEKHETTIDDILATCNYQARGERAFVPHYEEPYSQGNSGDLILVDYKSRLNREGRSVNCTWYHELKDVDPGDEGWDDVAKLNPIDGKRLGIESGDKVKLISPTGQLECTAKLWEGTRPVIPAEYDRLSGSSAFYAVVKVRVEKI